jgi:hypothetical protein
LPFPRSPRDRALAVPLEHLSPNGRAVARRRWYRPEHEPLPSEPGRLVVCALLQRARAGRGCITPGDDRLEIRAYAVKRYLFRLGHAARSGRYACSIEQLVVGLAPVMGWGAIPSQRAERTRFVRAHRKSVQRWLDDLAAAGAVAHEPERDEHGRWWRTQIVLLTAPLPSPEELSVAKVRARGWRTRERARRRQRRRACALATIRARGSVPQPGTRRRLARARACMAREARRRAAVEAQILRGRRLAQTSGDLTHPFGAPPASADVSPTATRHSQEQTSQASASAAVRSVPTSISPPAPAAETDARARRAPAPPAARAQAEPKECSEEIARLSPGDLDAVALRRIAERERRLVEQTVLRISHLLRRSQEVIDWPVGRPCPLGLLAEAWVTHRYGPTAAAETGAAAAGRRSMSLASRAARAIALYEAFSDQRPRGWPQAGRRRCARWLASGAP